MAGVVRLQVDPSLSGSVIAIALLCLMISDVPLHWLNVRSLGPPGSIGVRLVGCQGD